MRRPRGFNLAEVLVAGLLLAVILGIAYLFLDFGLDNSELTRTMVEAQESVNRASYRISRELMESDPLAIQLYPDVACVVFPSARDAQGRFQVHPVSGRPIWQKYVAYYLAQDPETTDARVAALYRVELSNPVFPTPDARPAGTVGLSASSVMATNGAQLIGHGLVAPTAARPHGGFDVYALAPDGSPRYDLSSSPIVVDLEAVNRDAAVSRLRAGVARANSVVSHLRIDIRS